MDDEKPFHNPFDALRALRDRLPAAPDPPELAAPSVRSARPSGRAFAAPQDAAPAKTIPRAVVRMERSGRGGKEVTVIEQLGLTPNEREAWLKALKAGLGCGGVVEGESLVLQGDQRTRVPKLLTARGVKRITVA